VLLALLAGCERDSAPLSTGEAPPAPLAARSARASATLAAIRDQLPEARALLAPIAPIEPTEADHTALDITLGSAASAGMTLREPRSGVSVEVTLAGAQPKEALIADGFLVHPGVLHGRADAFARALPGGAEDFVYLRERPQTAQLDYTLTLGPAVAGLRLLEGTLEILDAKGAPRLRALPPYVIDAAGKHPASLTIEGCAVDHSPIAPWRRPVLPAGARACTLRVTWGAEVAYPALVDPSWTSTAGMSVQRIYALAARMNADELLVGGGQNLYGAGGTTWLTSEIYSLSAGAWALTGNLMSNARTAVAFPDGRVLATLSAGVSFAIYNPASGLWTAAAAAPAAATLGTILLDGRMLSRNANKAFLYNLDTDTWTPIAPTLVSRTFALQQRLLDGRVLVASGNGSNGQTLTSAEIYDPVAASWTMTTSLSSSKTAGRSALLPGGKVFTIDNTASTVEIYDPATATWSAGPVLADTLQPRNEYSLSSLVDGRVLLAGGFIFGGAQTATKSAEIYDPVTSTWSHAGPLLGYRTLHFAAAFPSGQVLIGGGSNSVNAAALGLPTCELYGQVPVPACASGAACPTGFCVNGVCCDQACTGPCLACSALAKGNGLDGVCGLITGCDPMGGSGGGGAGGTGGGGVTTTTGAGGAPGTGGAAGTGGASTTSGTGGAGGAPGTGGAGGAPGTGGSTATTGAGAGGAPGTGGSTTTGAGGSTGSTTTAGGGGSNSGGGGSAGGSGSSGGCDGNGSCGIGGGRANGDTTWMLVVAALFAGRRRPAKSKAG
jgi:hypothetical protein